MLHAPLPLPSTHTHSPPPLPHHTALLPTSMPISMSCRYTTPRGLNVSSTTIAEVTFWDNIESRAWTMGRLWCR